MTVQLVNQGRATRQTISTSFKIPACYQSLMTNRGATGTTEINGQWDDEWVGRSTEARRDPRDPLSMRSMTMSDFLVSGVGGPIGVQRFLTKVLLETADRPNVTETTESPRAYLPDWSRWHELRARATVGELLPSDADELAVMTGQARMLDKIAVEHQIDVVRPVLHEHSLALKSLSQIANLLERAINAAERTTGGNE